MLSYLCLYHYSCPCCG